MAQLPGVARGILEITLMVGTANAGVDCERLEVQTANVVVGVVVVDVVVVVVVVVLGMLSSWKGTKDGVAVLAPVIPPGVVEVKAICVGGSRGLLVVVVVVFLGLSNRS